MATGYADESQLIALCQKLPGLIEGVRRGEVKGDVCATLQRFIQNRHSDIIKWFTNQNQPHPLHNLPPSLLPQAAVDQFQAAQLNLVSSRPTSPSIASARVANSDDGSTASRTTTVASQNNGTLNFSGNAAMQTRPTATPVGGTTVNQTQTERQRAQAIHGQMIQLSQMPAEQRAALLNVKPELRTFYARWTQSEINKRQQAQQQQRLGQAPNSVVSSTAASVQSNASSPQNSSTTTSPQKQPTASGHVPVTTIPYPNRGNVLPGMSLPNRLTQNSSPAGGLSTPPNANAAAPVTQSSNDGSVVSLPTSQGSTGTPNRPPGLGNLDREKFERYLKIPADQVKNLSSEDQMYWSRVQKLVKDPKAIQEHLERQQRDSAANLAQTAAQRLGNFAGSQSLAPGMSRPPGTPGLGVAQGSVAGGPSTMPIQRQGMAPLRQPSPRELAMHNVKQIVSSVDEKSVMGGKTHDMLTDIAESLLMESMQGAARIAKSRVGGSGDIEVQDVAAYMNRTHGVQVPGWGVEAGLPTSNLRVGPGYQNAGLKAQMKRQQKLKDVHDARQKAGNMPDEDEDMS